MSFKEEFLEYFNENILNEPPQLRQEYKLENAKFIFFYDEEKKGELDRCYLSFIQFLIENKLSLDYLTKEMIQCNSKQRSTRFEGKMQLYDDQFIIISPIASRKPKQAKGKSLDITKVPVNFVNKFNLDYKVHKNKVNTYDTFELTMTAGELEDLTFFKKKFVEAYKKHGYTLYQIKTECLKIECIQGNNYLVRYFYEG